MISPSACGPLYTHLGEQDREKAGHAIVLENQRTTPQRPSILKSQALEKRLGVPGNECDILQSSPSRTDKGRCKEGERTPDICYVGEQSCPEMWWEKPLASRPTALSTLRLLEGLADAGRAVPRQPWEPTPPGTALHTADSSLTPAHLSCRWCEWQSPSGWGKNYLGNETGSEDGEDPSPRLQGPQNRKHGTFDLSCSQHIGGHRGSSAGSPASLVLGLSD